MILSVICLLVIVLMTLYMATQGFLTSLLLLVSALFASVLAMGVYEPLAPLISSLRPDYAAGLMFLVVFLVSFAVIRIISDVVVPKNIQLNPLVDKAAGGAIGILAALIIVGTAMTGFEMLPLPESIGGTPAIQDSRQPGSRNRLAAANLVTGLYYTASGNALGGKPLQASHPDLAAELIGYRHTVAPGSRTSLDPNLVAAKFWYAVTPEQSKALKIEASGLKGTTIIVRTEIDKGGEQPKSSAESTDKGAMLLLTPTQVRLVSADEKGNTRQYYPTGLLDRGRTFRALPLATGYTIDDYAAEKVVYEWVFEIDDGQTPQFIEIKRGGRATLVDKEVKKEQPASARNAYPPHEWLASAANLQVSVKINGTPVSGALVMRLAPEVPKGNVSSLVSALGEAIVPGGNGMDNNQLIRMKNADNKELLSWSDLIRIAVQAKAKGGSMPPVWEYIAGDLKRTMTESETVKSEALTNAQGEAESKNVAPGTYLMVVAAHNDDALRVWTRELKWDPADKRSGKSPNLQENFDGEPLVEMKAAGK